MNRSKREFARFLLVGASNTLLSYVVFRLGLGLFAGLAAPAAIAQAVAYSAGIAWSFVWNRSWTFRSAAPVAGSFARFGAVQLLLLGVSSALLGVAVDGLGWPATPVWVLVLGAVAVVNFWLQRRFVFAPIRAREPTPAARSQGSA